MTGNSLYEDSVSTYRIFSRAFCNFVFPGEIGRPLPQETLDVTAAAQVPLDEDILDNATAEEKLQNTDGKYNFNIRANRFLQHMVRYLVGTMLEVARGRYELKDFSNLINRRQTNAVITRAPAQGLFLKKVNYD